MALANLLVADELQSSFLAAQQSSTTRWIKATVADVNISFDTKGQATADLANDVKSLKASLGKKPCYVIFCLDPSASAKKWVLVAYVPDATSKVREKMLYASGRYDLKKTLGPSHFKGELHLSDLNDLTADNIRNVAVRDNADAPLTETEKLQQLELSMEVAPTGSKSHAMGLVPFQCSSALEKALQEFAEGTKNFVEISVSEHETLELESAKVISSTDKMKNLVVSSDPRYYLLAREILKTPKKYFIYLCPDVCKVKTRMLYSTCKATVLHECSTRSVEFDKMLEVREGDEVDDTLTEESTPQAPAGKITQQAFSKPSRPGRGKARMIKKPAA